MHKGKANEFFPKKQREDFMSEELSNKVIMEAGDMVEGAIWGCAPLGHQDMDVRMKLMRSPKVWMTVTIPGINSWPVTVRKYFDRAWTAARASGERRALFLPVAPAGWDSFSW